MSIIPIKINTETILDARDLIKLTVCFTNTIPNAVTVTSATSTVLPIETSPFLTGLSVGCDNASFSVTATSPAGTLVRKCDHYYAYNGSSTTIRYCQGNRLNSRLCALDNNSSSKILI